MRDKIKSILEVLEKECNEKGYEALTQAIIIYMKGEEDRLDDATFKAAALVYREYMKYNFESLIDTELSELYDMVIAEGEEDND